MSGLETLALWIAVLTLAVAVLSFLAFAFAEWRANGIRDRVVDELSSIRRRAAALNDRPSDTDAAEQSVIGATDREELRLALVAEASTAFERLLMRDVVGDARLTELYRELSRDLDRHSAGRDGAEPE